MAKKPSRKSTTPRSQQPAAPAKVLREFIARRGMSATKVAHSLGVPPNRITRVLSGARGITADTTLRLARYFGTTPQYWMNLQTEYELQLARRQAGMHIAKRINLSTAYGCEIIGPRFPRPGKRHRDQVPEAIRPRPAGLIAKL